jgi:hypothetical protein
MPLLASVSNSSPMVSREVYVMGKERPLLEAAVLTNFIARMSTCFLSKKSDLLFTHPFCVSPLERVNDHLAEPLLKVCFHLCQQSIH